MSFQQVKLALCAQEELSIKSPLPYFIVWYMGAVMKESVSIFYCHLKTTLKCDS